MSKLFVGRISYCSPKSKRMDRVANTWQDLKQLVPQDVDMCIMAQNYGEGYKHDPRLEVISYEGEPKGPAFARNVLLEKFYESDYDYMLCLDDDVSFYDYYNVRGLLKDINDNPNEFISKGIDIIKSIEPTYVPFKKQNEKYNLEQEYVFVQAPMSQGGGAFILVNLNKYKGFKMFFDTTYDPRKGEGREDIDFFIRALKKNLNVLECRNLIQKNYCNTEELTSLTASNGGEVIKKATLATAQRHGIEMQNGRIRYSKSLTYFKGEIHVQANSTKLKEKAFVSAVYNSWGAK